MTDLSNGDDVMTGLAEHFAHLAERAREESRLRGVSMTRACLSLSTEGATDE